VELLASDEGLILIVTGDEGVAELPEESLDVDALGAVGAAGEPKTVEAFGPTAPLAWKDRLVSED
jgi:hypothetical protein